MQEIALLNYHQAHYLHDALLTLPHFRTKFQAPFFNEFVLELKDRRQEQLLEGALDEAGIVGGLPLGGIDETLAGSWLWCVTETKTRAQLDRVVQVLRGVHD